MENLASILAQGSLLSDARMAALGGPPATVGMKAIKQRRLALAVECHPGSHVGDYVPFNFCPRSVMLYLLHRGNHAELQYKGGQGPLLHLEADLLDTVAWAEGQDRRWAISTVNAAAVYTDFLSRLDQLGAVNWSAVASNDFREASVKDAKQAEFLLHESFPFHLVVRVGAHNRAVRDEAARLLSAAAPRPPVDVVPAWYYT